MSNEIKDNIKKQSTWIRGLYMLLFTIFSRMAEVVLFAIILFQFILKLLTGNTNERLRKLGQGLTTYIYQILQFLSFNSDVHPYPFGTWPAGEPKTESAPSKKAKTTKPTKEAAAKKIEKD